MSKRGRAAFILLMAAAIVMTTAAAARAELVVSGIGGTSFPAGKRHGTFSGRLRPYAGPGGGAAYSHVEVEGGWAVELDTWTRHFLFGLACRI